MFDGRGDVGQVGGGLVGVFGEALREGVAGHQALLWQEQLDSRFLVGGADG